MLQPRSRLDPEGFYAILGLDPAATRDAVKAAFRRKARVLHPDIPITGDARQFVALKQAYDVLSNRKRRDLYDQAARARETAEERPAVHVPEPQPTDRSAPAWF